MLTTAHSAGVRHLAMEALHPRFAEKANETRAVPAATSGYLAQADMRDLIASALDLGWTLVDYEAERRLEPSDVSPRSMRRINWREEQQARNLATALQALPNGERLLVWCGNGHLSKRARSTDSSRWGSAFGSSPASIRLLLTRP